MTFRCTACSRRAPGALTARTARITSHCNATIRQPARQLRNMGQPRATPTPETETLHWTRTRYNTVKIHVIKIPAIEQWVLQIPRAPEIVSSNRIKSQKAPAIPPTPFIDVCWDISRLAREISSSTRGFPPDHLISEDIRESKLVTGGA